MVANKVFAVAGAKGGVGKTTTSLNLAAALAADGFSVVAVEMDLSMPNFADFLEIEDYPVADSSLREVLAGTAPIEDATYTTSGGFSVVPSRTDIETDEQLSLTALDDVIEDLLWRFDIIFLDTPAGHSDETVRSMRVADETIIISTPRTASIENANNTISLANQHEASLKGFILNKSGTGASPGVDTIAESLPVPLLGHVPEDEAVPHSQDQGSTVVTESPNSGAGIAYKRLADELLDVSPAGQTPDQAEVNSISEQSAASTETQELVSRDQPPSAAESDPESESTSPWTFSAEDSEDVTDKQQGSSSNTGLDDPEPSTDSASETTIHSSAAGKTEQQSDDATENSESETSKRRTSPHFIRRILSRLGL